MLALKRETRRQDGLGVGRLLVAVLAVIGLLAGILPAAVGAAANTHFVSPTGHDTGSCLTNLTACRTISYAVSKASPGDTVQVAAGTYNESVSIPNSLAGLTLAGANAGDSAGLAPGPRGAESVITGGISIAASTVKVDGFRITGVAAGSNPPAGIDVLAAAASPSLVNNEIVTSSTAPTNARAIGLHASVSGATIAHNELDSLYAGTAINAASGLTFQDNNAHGSQYGLYLAGTLANISVTGNSFTANTVAGVFSSTTNTSGTVTARFNRIAGNHAGVVNAGGPQVNATDNWWGCNEGPSVNGCDAVSGAVSINPWLELTLTSSPTAIQTGGSATLTASLTTDSNGQSTTSSGTVPNGIPVGFATTLGALNPASATTSAGKATSTLTSSSVGTATVSASVDHETVSLAVTVTAPPVTPNSLSVVASPTSAQIGTSVALTATLIGSNSQPLSGTLVKFNVTGANTASGMDTTDANGRAHFSYTGTKAGTDTVTAYLDANNNGVPDTGELKGTTTVVWTSVPVTPPSAFGPAQPAAPKAGCTYFPQTQHNLCAGFQAYWNHFGGLAIYGYPLTEEFQENGMTVQYFERARFEWHPGVWPSHYDVLLGLVGDEVTAGRGAQAPFVATSARTGCSYFAATGHNLCNGFAAYWNQFGGLAAFGMPISEEFQERNPDTGQIYTVQYFERARFEWHPGQWPATYDVMLGRLGAQVLSMRYHTPY